MIETIVARTDASSAPHSRIGSRRHNRFRRPPQFLPLLLRTKYPLSGTPPLLPLFLHPRNPFTRTPPLILVFGSTLVLRTPPEDPFRRSPPLVLLIRTGFHRFVLRSASEDPLRGSPPAHLFRFFSRRFFVRGNVRVLPMFLEIFGDFPGR